VLVGLGGSRVSLAGLAGLAPGSLVGPR